MFKHSLVSLALLTPMVAGHSAFFHPSMYGFTVTDQTFPFDNRPVAPLKNRTFTDWWFHGHLDFPPNAGDFFELPAGGAATAEIACNKNATSYFTSADGVDARNSTNPNDVCPGKGIAAYHTTGPDDLTGCALAIAYKSDARDVKPEEFTVFSVNQTCVWTRFTEFRVPARMPPCPEGGCIYYMNGFKCNITGSASQAAVSLAPPRVPRRCGADPVNNKRQSAPANCTYGAKQPFYWSNQEGNNMFEGASTPPVYNDMYNFLDGAQDDIFEDSYSFLPDPSPVAALPALADMKVQPETNKNTSDADPSPISSSETHSKCEHKMNADPSNLVPRSVMATLGRHDRHWTPAISRRSRTLHAGKRRSSLNMF
ncbi:hypothetical protein FPV67DRAFT_1724500 [Lyophyllum atratum]|nr:hypothetical protein FPV67DRAFT_1724500 [Lyophyllum atratum]